MNDLERIFNSQRMPFLLSSPNDVTLINSYELVAEL